jgi:hypothetical protein
LGWIGFTNHCIRVPLLDLVANREGKFLVFNGADPDDISVALLNDIHVPVLLQLVSGRFGFFKAAAPHGPDKKPLLVSLCRRHTCEEDQDKK